MIKVKSIFLDIVSFLKSLSLIDYVLYFAILILIVLVVSLLYLLKTTGIDEEEIDSKDENDFDIKNAIEQISQEQPKNIDLTEYEKEQEEKAIISYEELVNSIKRNKINYADESNDDNISIKKIDLDNLISDEVEEQSVDYSYKQINFQHEEKYLKELKELISLLD